MAKSPKASKDHSPYLAEVEARRIARTVRELDSSLDVDQRQGVHGKRCLVCENSAFPSTPLCKACSDEFGPFVEWPEWLKFLKADAEKTRRHDVEADATGLADYDEDAEENRPLEEHPRAEFPDGYFPHGTESGYSYGCRCEACTRASSAARQRRRLSE